jgi:sulfate permease, SulP family
MPGVALLGSYDRTWLRPDALAALGVWALLIPQALAYAQLAGMPTVTGLYVGLFAMVAYGLFGTSRYLNIGPESSVAIVVASSLGALAVPGSERYLAMAATLALMVGAVLIAAYALRLGVVTRLLSSPILTGYLAGSAIVMSLSQLAKLFGIDVDREIYPYVVGGIVAHVGDTNPRAVAIGLGTMVVMVLARMISPKLPAGFIALVLATAVTGATGLVDHVAVVGTIPSGLPGFALPDLRLRVIVGLLIPAASLALLVFSGSVLTAQALAARDREDIEANREFLGLAAANVAVAFFHGFPAKGSESRSFSVASGGGRSQAVSFISAAMVLLTLLFLTTLFRDVPHAALGGVVLVTAANLFDLKAMQYLWRVRKADFILMAVTFTGVLAFGVLIGIVVGVVASLVEMVRRTIQPKTAVLGLVEGSATWRDVQEHEGSSTVRGLIVYRFDAPLFFGNADVLRDEIRELVRDAEPPVRQVVINAEAITDLDTTGVEMLARLFEDLQIGGVDLAFARVRSHVMRMMERTGLAATIGSDRFFLQVDEAVRELRSSEGSSD